MAHLAEFLIRDGDDWRCWIHRWGALGLGATLAIGVDAAIREIKGYDESQVAHFRNHRLVTEAAVAIDTVERVMLIDSAKEMRHLTARRAWWRLLAQAWPGWRLDWATGTRRIAAYAGITSERVVRDTPIVVPLGRVAGECAQLRPISAEAAELYRPLDEEYEEWLVVSLVHASGRVGGYAAMVDHADHAVLAGPDIVSALSTGEEASSSPRFVGAVVPCHGVHVDVPARSVGWWSIWNTPNAAIVAQQWPGWRVAFWGDDYRQQVDRCGGSLALPDEDLAAAIDEVAAWLHEYRLDSRVAGFVQCARASAKARTRRL